MLDQLEGLIKKYAGEAVSESSAVPNDKSEAVSSAASGSIIDLLKDKASSGDISSVMQMFNSEKGVQDSISQLSGGFVEKLTGQGFSMDNAKGIATAILPMILSKLTGKSGGAGGNIMDMLSQLGGKGDMGSVLGGLLGGNSKGKDSGVGGMLGKMKDLLS